MEKPIRVLHVLGGLDRGGAETMVMNLYRNIDRTKVQFDFIIHHRQKGAYFNEINALGGKIYNISKYTGVNHFQYRREWNDFFKKYPEYNVIHGHVRSTASIYLKVAKTHGRITISHSHSTSNGNGVTSFYKKILQKPIKNIADYFFAPSEESGEWLFGKKIIQQENFIRIRNSIETEKYIFNKNVSLKKREELGIPNNIVVGHVGRFTEVKNHTYLVEIFKQYQKINSNSTLLLIGSGPLEEKIKKLVVEYKLEEKVLFLGSRSDVNELMQAMDIFIMPSFFEGIPVTLIEAQSAGLPIIASDTITDEVAITDLITFKDINESPTEWAKIIDNKKLSTRGNKYNEIFNAGYDVKNTATALQNFYISMSDK